MKLLNASVSAFRKTIARTSPATTIAVRTAAMITTTRAVFPFGTGPSGAPWLRMCPVSDPEFSNGLCAGGYAPAP